jgi:hypothetical protein
MTLHTHVTAPTQFVEAGGIRFAHRRFNDAGEIGSRGDQKVKTLIKQGKAAVAAASMGEIV